MALALALGLLTTLANVAGSALAVMYRHPSRKWMANALAFGGGFLLAAALLEMVPEALEGGSRMPALVAAGFLIMYFTEHVGNVHMHSLPADEEHHAQLDPHASFSSSGSTPGVGFIDSHRGVAAFAAFNVHDFIDGLAIGAAMVTNQAIGVLVFLAVLLHEFPAGFAIAAIMRGAGWSRRAALSAGLSIGVVTLVGISIPFMVGDVGDTSTEVLLALAAGTFIYLGASILIPAAETGGYRWAFLYVGVGFAAFYGSSELVGSFLET